MINIRGGSGNRDSESPQERRGPYTFSLNGTVTDDTPTRVSLFLRLPRRRSGAGPKEQDVGIFYIIACL